MSHFEPMELVLTSVSKKKLLYFRALDQPPTEVRKTYPHAVARAACIGSNENFPTLQSSRHPWRPSSCHRSSPPPGAPRRPPSPLPGAPPDRPHHHPADQPSTSTQLKLIRPPTPPLPLATTAIRPPAAFTINRPNLPANETATRLPAPTSGPVT
jgi:hypothetical protein